ncbi:hypothetical protein [Demequina mangrovi]|uniref:Uncharacterized protein n=1 Tax=Demequina mangrovi TaxID=1043493 RepID=A0A1H6ZMS5_9MICO|nr:hypothetical protein [Demequina mangrovi]SEJ50890.1 hypothetical protein SAMN05421637_2070 [Demequina mangrovi]
MTVPHISVGSWSSRRGRTLLPEVRAWAGVRRPARDATAVASGRGIAWFDVLVQAVAGAAIAYGMWWVLSAGVVGQAVDAFAGWYVGTATPAFATGTSAVQGATEFSEGFFAPLPAPPAMLTYDGPALLEFQQSMTR